MTTAEDEILGVIRRILAPLVAADGGELYIVQAAEGEVALHLGGRFSGCPGNTLVTRRFIEPLIQSVAPRARVTVTSGHLIPEGATHIPGNAEDH
jgi:Fe-S cluster biogenesis protein NfuA